MEEVYICELCQRVYQPIVTVNHPNILRTFKGYTVDLRLQQFRKVDYYSGKHPEIEFIEFNSPKGKKLLALMHREVTKRLFHELKRQFQKEYKELLEQIERLKKKGLLDDNLNVKE